VTKASKANRRPQEVILPTWQVGSLAPLPASVAPSSALQVLAFHSAESWQAAATNKIINNNYYQWRQWMITEQRTSHQL